ncbi:MAG: preprotein translocase subunit YajC [Lachnospiraceae bacterium]|nr:preprotein translocase subunit YajC [Lachnospiraceae bacterium]
MNFLLMTSEEAAASATGSLVSMVVIYGVLIFALWFFFMRPQSKERKKTQEMLSNLENGDIVCTTSGFYGTIIDIQDDMVIVEFGNNRNCRIPMEKAAISKVEKPGQATASDSDKDSKK